MIVGSSYEFFCYKNFQLLFLSPVPICFSSFTVFKIINLQRWLITRTISFTLMKLMLHVCKFQMGYQQWICTKHSIISEIASWFNNVEMCFVFTMYSNQRRFSLLFYSYVNFIAYFYQCVGSENRTGIHYGLDT